MPIADPSNILQRVPELKKLLHDSAIRFAIESGDTFKVFRALMFAKLTHRLPRHRALLQMLTAQRRLFCKPLSTIPKLGTFHSIGFRILGQAEKGEDGAYIAMHAFVVLKKIPLIPFGAYLVSAVDDNHWRVHARVPLGIAGWLYTRGIALTAVVSVLAGAALSFYQIYTQDYYLLNGFDEAVTVQWAAKSVQVPAHGYLKLNFKTGPLKMTAQLPQFGVIDKLEKKLVSDQALHIWNIGGATPLVLNRAEYRPASGDFLKTKKVFCGARDILLGQVDDMFTEPAKASSEMQAGRLQLEIESRNAGKQALTCVQHALSAGRGREIAKTAEILAVKSNWAEEYANYAFEAALHESSKEASRVARLAVAAQPDNAKLHRRYQVAALRNGQKAELFEEYRSLAQQNPTSADAQYRYASLFHGREGLQKLSLLQRQFGNHVEILQSLAQRRLMHGDIAGSLRDFQAVQQLSNERANEISEVQSAALAASGHLPEALASLQAANVGKDSKRSEDAMVHGLQIARQLGKGEQAMREFLEKKSDVGISMEMVRLRLGLPLLQDKAAWTPVQAFVNKLLDQPYKAYQDGRQLSLAQVRSLADEYWVMLLALAVKESDTSMLKTMADDLRLLPEESLALQQYFAGQVVDLAAYDFSLEMQASAYLMRAYLANIGSAERDQLRQHAAAFDIWRGPVATALKRWK